MNRSEYDKILKEAIDREIESQEFYKDVAGRMTDENLKKLFADFVKEEKKHQEILEGFRVNIPQKLPFDESRDYHVAETVDEPRLSTDMKPADAFKLAMKKEEDAMKTYQSLSIGATDPEQKRLFEELASMEQEHKLKMENAFVDIGYPEVW